MVPVVSALQEKTDAESFDFSWHPYSADEPFIYQFGTQHQKTGGPRYVTPGVHGGSAVNILIQEF